jgi:O-antigen/teichoic acid export membrane protein
LGIIQKQALRTTIISFIGIGFGSITRLLLPFVLESAQIGIVALLDSISGLFVVVFNFGYNLILKKLFPKYRDEENGHGGFLVFGILLSIVGVLIGTGVFLLIENYMFANNGTKGELLKPFAYLIPMVIFFRVLFLNIDGYVRMLFNTVIGTLLESFVSKLILLIAIVLVSLSYLTFEYFIYAYCLVLSIPGLIILLYAFSKTNKITLPSKDLLGESKQIKMFILFGILSGSSSSIIQYADILMINKLSVTDPESMMGIYSIMFFAAMLLGIPARSINKISSVILAESWKEKDMDNIQDVYAKSATNLLVIGTFLFVIGWSCIDPVLTFLPAEYEIGKYVFFFLGLAKLIELATGVNTEVIDTSAKYKYNTYFNTILAALVIGLNFFLIQFYGIVGAAIASFIAMTFINFLRAMLLKRAYNLWPFTGGFYKMVFIGIAFIILTSVLDFQMSPVVELTINFFGVSLLYWFIIIKMKISPEINEWLLKMKNRFL